VDGLAKIQSTDLLDTKLKKKIIAKFQVVQEIVLFLEGETGIKYPPYYVEPVLTVVESFDNIGGLGVLYARTIPVDYQGRVAIVIQLSAPLVLYGLKTTIRAILGHEFLHYVDLVRRFVLMDTTSIQAGETLFEEQYVDAKRAVDPSSVFKNKKLVTQISKRIGDGLKDAKLDEKCRINWLEKGLPTVKTTLNQNHSRISVKTIQRSIFDPKVTEIVKNMPSAS